MQKLARSVRRVSNDHEGLFEREVGGDKAPSREAAHNLICVPDFPGRRSNIVTVVLSHRYLIPASGRAHEEPFRTP